MTEGSVRLAKFIQNSLFPMVVGTGIEFSGHNGRQDGALEDNPSDMLTQVEFIIAKKLVRPAVNLNDWNRLWHDHAVEIAGGRVQVLDLSPDKAKEVADLVATTDGIIYSFQFDGNVPNGKVVMAQAVGHRPLTAKEYEQSK